MIKNIIPLPFVLWMHVKNGRAEDERQRYFVGYVAGMGWIRREAKEYRSRGERKGADQQNSLYSCMYNGIMYIHNDCKYYTLDSRVT